MYQDTNVLVLDQSSVINPASPPNNGPQPPGEPAPSNPGPRFNLFKKYTQISVLSKNHCLGTAARTFTRDLAIGEGIGAVAGGVTGGLVAAGFTAASDTFPFAGQTIPSGIVSGTLVGTVEALPLTYLGGLVDAGLGYLSCH
jgi:hypothetical protein